MRDARTSHLLMIAARSELAEAVGMLGSDEMDIVVTDEPAALETADLDKANGLVLVPGDDTEWLQQALTMVGAYAASGGAVRLVTANAGSTRPLLGTAGALDGWSIGGLHIERDVVSVDVEPVEPDAHPRESLPADAADLVVEIVLGRDREDLESPDEAVALAVAHVQLHRLQSQLAEVRAALEVGSSAPQPITTRLPPSAIAPKTSAAAAEGARSGLVPLWRHRKLVIAGGIALLAGVALVVLRALEVVSSAEGLGIACLAGLGAVLVDQRRRARLISNRTSYGIALAISAQKSIDRVGKSVGHVASAVEEWGAKSSSSAEVTRVVLAGESRATSDRLVQIERGLQTIGAELSSAIAQQAADASKQVVSASNSIRRSLQRAYEQIECNFRLRDVVEVTGLTPGLRGWAASPDVIIELIRQLRLRRPRVILECGSGASTVWMTLACRTAGIEARVVALEHESDFAAATRQALADCGIADHADVIDAPLVEVALNGTSYRWYSPSAWEHLHNVGMLFVDGPPSSTGVEARYPAVPMVWDRLTDDALIVLDDTVREDERSIAARWAEEHPELDLMMINLEKGAALLQRRVQP